MATDSTVQGVNGSNASQSLAGFVSSKKNDQISKDQFLQLLVTQLKNQDPLDPMKSEEFAVNLAQFSQLEQLVSINDKIGDSSSDLSTLATYLGQEVALNRSTIRVEGGNGGLLRMNLPSDTDSMEVSLTDTQGRVQQVVRFENLKKGPQSLPLDNLNVANGNYTFSIKATSGNVVSEVAAKPGGLVSGFIPGPNPKLIVNGEEITPSDVTEVAVPKSIVS